MGKSCERDILTLKQIINDSLKEAKTNRFIQVSPVIAQDVPHLSTSVSWDWLHPPYDPLKDKRI